METQQPSPSRSPLLSDNAWLLYLVLAKFLIHCATNLTGGYGYFRDEFYYIACSDHMAWGFVDQPPLSIAALWISRFLFGDTLFALRLLPAVAGAVSVGLAGLMTRELGGRKYAQILVACLVLVAPLTLGTNSVFSMNSFDVLFWTLAFYLIILNMKRNEQKHWVLLGVVLGFGLLNKISVLWLGAGLGAGLLMTSNRTRLQTRKVWIAAAITLLLFLPHVIWQVVNGFPTLEFIRNAMGNKYSAVNALEMFIQQAQNMNLLTFPIWLAGVIYFLFSRSTRQYRVLPIIYLTVFLVLVVSRNSKAEYLGPMFPVLFVMGAVAVELFILRFNWRWLKPVALGLPVLGGIAVAPLAVAVLPVDMYIAYTQALGMKPSTSERKDLRTLPQHYADMFGWEELVGAVAAAYNSLSPEEKAKCAILANNYGEAGAIDFFGGRYNLPKAISGHNNYWLWGPRSATGEVVIRLGGSLEAVREAYAEANVAGVFTNDYCMPYENNMTIFVCKGRRRSLTEDWPEFKHFE